jgi:hypothetical protein
LRGSGSSANTVDTALLEVDENLEEPKCIIPEIVGERRSKHMKL